MSFFFNSAKKADGEAKAKPKAKAGKRADIPIASLRQLGCSVCPRDKDTTLKSPKMEPSGARSARVYLLGAYPNEEDDATGTIWSGKMGRELYSKFGPSFMDREVRSGFITQCAGGQTVVEVECCRNRVVADIEATRPLIVVGIGDEALYWATGLTSGGAIPHRGTTFVTKIGNHVCYYIPLLYPHYLHKKKNYGKSEYEMTLEHDIEVVKDLLDNMTQPKVYAAPYDTGIELITGNEPGDMQRLEQALIELAREPKSAIDIETNGLRPFTLKDPHIWTVAVGTFNRTVAFALDHPEGWGTEARRRQVWGLFGKYLLTSGRKTAHNLAFEMEWFAFFFGGKILRQTEWDDTMAMCHTLDERLGTKSLDIQCRINFGFFLKSLSNLDTKRIVEYPVKEVLKYNALDTKWTDLLRDTLAPRLAAKPVYLAEYERKVRLAPTLVLTEIKGLPVDFGYAQTMSDRLTLTMTTAEGKIRRCPEVKEFSGRFGSFSPTNPDHVLKLMKEICKRDEIRVEDKRSGVVRWTTDEEALSKIPSKDVPSAPLILEHRAVSKLLGTYIKPVLDRKIVGPDDQIRCKYSSMIAVTGRLASEDPNIQNWPARKHKEIRGIIYAPEGHWMLACDYGQIEFRVVGMASEDANLVKYCWTGYDAHGYWAQRMVDEYGPIKDYIVEAFGVDWDEKGLKTLRQEAKNGWVFPQLFGSSTHSCAEQLHLPEHVAENLAAEFWDEFRGVKKWQEKLLKSYAKNLYIETLGGRRRRGPMTKNEIINMPIQGTALDIVTEAMNVLSERSQFEDDPDLCPNLNVHDDLTFIIPDANLEPKLEIIAREMCLPRFDYINVPLIIEAKVGARWHDMTEIKVYKSHELFGHTNPYETKEKEHA